MGLRGIKPRGEISTQWSANLAYAIGLISSDGNLSPNGRIVTFVSKDLQLINALQSSLGIDKIVHYKSSGFAPNKRYAFINICDILFYNFLLSIGLSAAKSKTIGILEIPDEYFIDFLRGSFDGDGSFYSYWDKRWRSSFMHYVQFVSASKKHVFWLRAELLEKTGCVGHISESKNSSVYQLRYAKRESFKIIRKMYPTKNSTCLSRKRLKIEKALRIIGKKL